MEEQNYVTALREIEGRSLRDIAAHTGYHFNTVKKYADNEDWNMAYRPRKQRTSGLDPLKPTIDEWIREDLKRKRKHRRTATKTYNDLVANETLSQLLLVGKQTVTNYVSKRKKELSVTPYSTAMYKMWLEVGANEIRILNERYEWVATHTRKYGRQSEPEIKFAPYITALVRKPRAFLKSPYFLTLPETVQNHLKNCGYQDLRKTLLMLLPIIQDDKLGDAAAVLELSEIHSPDDFAAAYRALTEDPRTLPEVVTPMTPTQPPTTVPTQANFI